ncbi:MAG: hypothetical protein FWB86_11265 [Treponema sp.]|nr:hypothetical protein [Treponema sp.]MCL2252487.1 hypothetical protein [Treponema sp.]
MKKLAFFFLLPLLAMPLLAQDYESSRELMLQVSSLPEAKLGFTQTFKFPFLQGDNPLTENNNIALALTAEVTPISLNGIFKAVLTPVAFIEITAGARMGAGWPLNLFGSDIYGTGFNTIGVNKESKYDGSPFDALLWKVNIGGTFQFDLAAVVPGDWNHIVFLSYHEINYHANTRAKNGEAWYYENDDGENRNGFNYFGNFVLGYQMPIFLNMVAFMAEMDLYLYDGDNRKDWGDDLLRWKFSNILNFKITEQFSIALITQFRTRRNFTNFNEDKDDLHYQERILNTANPMRLEFYRVAAIVSYKL